MVAMADLAGKTGMSSNERLSRICALAGEAFWTEAFADHIARVAAGRDTGGDGYTADALRTMARVYRARAYAARGCIAALSANDVTAQLHDA